MSSQPLSRIKPKSVKPRSAVTASPLSSTSPQASVISLSGMEPGKAADTKEMHPQGAMPMRNFRVWRFLYVDMCATHE